MSRPLPSWRILLSLALCLGLALAPALAEARAGGSFSGGHSFSSSMGSRGSRSFESNGAQPLSRSMTQTPGTSPLAGGSFFQRHPFLTGLGGGFLLSWLFGGHGAFGGLFGMLILGLLIVAGIRLFRARGFMSSGLMPRSVGAAAAPAARFRGRDIVVADADLTAFQGLHAAVQEAWSRGDLARLRQLMTPEMLTYFSEELTRNTSQGVQNVVSNVHLLKGDMAESWEEGDLQYATAHMRWSAVDYVARIGRTPQDPDYIVGGDPRAPTEAEEVWTFVRRRGAGWLLSAIQQV